MVLQAATNSSGSIMADRESIFFKDLAPFRAVKEGKLTDKEARI